MSSSPIKELLRLFVFYLTFFKSMVCLGPRKGLRVLVYRNLHCLIGFSNLKPRESKFWTAKARLKIVFHVNLLTVNTKMIASKSS